MRTESALINPGLRVEVLDAPCLQHKHIVALRPLRLSDLCVSFKISRTTRQVALGRRSHGIGDIFGELLYQGCITAFNHDADQWFCT